MPLRRSELEEIEARLVSLRAAIEERQRVERQHLIEQERMRVAQDLHDELGATITEVSMLGSLARTPSLPAESKDRYLDQLTTVSRSLVATLDEIVWAVNPRRDSLLDLILRMRSFANEVLAGRQIEFQFVAPDRELTQKLGAELRRDVFLIFKESLNNAVRHSNCTHVMIELRLDQYSLTLVVSDDGCGFAASGSSEGHGLVSMQRRAKALGGELKLQSLAGEGTKVSFSVPRRRRS